MGSVTRVQILNKANAVGKDIHLSVLFSVMGKYCKIQPIRQLFKLDKISTKQRIDFYGRAKIQTFTTEWTTSKTILLYNLYTLLSITPADCHKHFQIKLLFGEHMQL